MDYNDFILEVMNTAHTRGNLRLGQFFVNKLHAVNPKCAALLHASDYNCFYDDERLTDAIEFIATRWCF